ncbi:cell division protein FtsQ [Jejuia pallidilutea]|uniref:Cell division protein FtsQ n=1 Tax=Jejuia pallidilutea TaxID=504487 RepID=A0A090VTS6_9FLAO|nr:cell division protein FtsQ [Jejuia pallidilutea]
MLIQNQDSIKNVPKETLDLNVLELALNSNPMIKSAEVYVAVNGTLNAEIKQKKTCCESKHKRILLYR